MQLSDLVNIIDGRLIGKDTSINQFIIDGRKAKFKDCYVALNGENLNGHLFIEQAIKQGATSAIVSQVSTHAIPLILVEDTTQALAKLASYHRSQFHIPTLALTGSCGKTTVKEMMKSILPSSALVSPGNLNNHIGVPLSLLSLTALHTHAVFELGANHIGEIAQSASWVNPDYSLITLIAPAHLEGFGSIEGVAQAKGEIFKALSKSGTAIINLDDPRVVKQSQNHFGKKISYSMTERNADVLACELIKNNDGSYQFALHNQNESINICLQVPGKHNVCNALTASAAAIAMDISLQNIKMGLEKFCGVQGRLAIKRGKRNAKLIDDSYNANLASVKAAIDVLSEQEGQRILVLGELAEAGDSLHSHYHQIGQYARDKKIDKLITCGNESQTAQENFGQQGLHFTNQKALIESLISQLSENSTLLIKGSRSAQMEKVLQHLI